jgi:transcriptional antiterminator
MLCVNDAGKKITISSLAKLLNCTTRTIYRNMTNELKKEKELLNKGNEEIQYFKLC